MPPSVLAQHPEAELVLELRHPLGVYEVVVVLARELRPALGELLRRAGRGELAERGEEVLEARGPDDLEQVRRLARRVPERVGDAARLEDVAARPGYVVAVADPDADLAAQDVGELVLVVVDVRRDESARIERVLDDGKRSAGSCRHQS
jgi:hypothetical protein